MKHRMFSHYTWIKRIVVALAVSLVAVAVLCSLSPSQTSQAQDIATPTAVPTPLPPTPPPPGFQVTLEDLGYGEKVLASPWGSTQYTFRLPDNWLVAEDSYLDIEFSYFFSALTVEQASLSYFGQVLIYLDGTLLDVYHLQASTLERIHRRVYLPPDALNAKPGSNHSIKLELDSSFLCHTLHKAQLVVHPESLLALSYSASPPILDLARYPRPFYQRSFDTDQITFILPEQPSEPELRTAAAVAAKLGELTSGLIISATTDADWLSRIEAGNNLSAHLFVVGQPGRNRLIEWLNAQVSLPIPVRRQEADYVFVAADQPVPEGDGILQEIVSPWDAEKVILLITGADEEALYKAGQALTLETHFPAMLGPTALIREIRPTPPLTAALTVDYTLADLDYTDDLLYGAYQQEVTYWFPVPVDWRLTGEAVFRLHFQHSTIVDEQISTLTILLNDTPLADTRLTPENAGQGVLEANLPDSAIRHGTSNKLTVRVWMQTDEERCERIDVKQVWFRIAQDSRFHLPHQEQHINTLNLDYFPYPFDGRPNLDDILFVLPASPGPGEQESLLRLASALGDATNGAGFSPAVSLGGEGLDDDTLSQYHVILVGRPTTNSLLRQINHLLPQPFVPDSDDVEYQIGEVLLRLEPDTSLGFIQELPSPWNEQCALLAITGTTDEGVAWAARAVTRYTWRLHGNLVLVRAGGVEIQSIDTRSLTAAGQAQAVLTVVPELMPVATLTATTTTPPPATPPTSPPAQVGTVGGLPVWVLAVVAITILTVVVILFAALRQSRKR